MPHLTINGIPTDVADGGTVLEACRSAGVNVPTLCHMEGLSPVGACRVCVVEVEGAKTLVASCVTPAAEGMNVWTNTRRVRDARRTVVELLLSSHDGECQTCERSGDCELQILAREMGIREIEFRGEAGSGGTDVSTPALVRETSKCILCRRCVSVCNEVQNVGALFPQGRGFEAAVGPAFCADLDQVSCVQCGQCAAVCPVGAITEQDHTQRVWAALDDPSLTVIVQTAPAIRAALGECFGYPPGTLVTGKMVAALRRMGFDAVFDTEFSADLTIVEEGTELLTRLKKALADREEIALPQFTSCCPAWIKFVEYYHPDLIPHISTCKSPQQMFGSLAKTYYANRIGRTPQQVFVVSVMPCTAKKFEAQREEMFDSGARDVDAVLTTRELGRMIAQAGIDFRGLPDEEMDEPFGRTSSGAADIFANTGGVMEAALRTAHEIVTGRPLPFEGLHVAPVAGLEKIKEAAITIENAVPEWSFLDGATLRVAVAHGLGSASRLIERIRKEEASYHFIEVMACPGGCIGGGGQPRFTTDDVRTARIEAIYREDEQKRIRVSHKNPEIEEIYGAFLGTPLGEKSHHLLHTRYQARQPV